MPGMRLFGRRCALSTDDFLFIGLVEFILYLPWLGWVPVVYASFLKQRFMCKSDHVLLLLDISFPGLCLLFLANWIMGALFLIFSSRGTISQPEPRRHVVTIVYMKLIVSALDVAWASLGTVILHQNCYCDIIGVSLVIKVCTIFQWVATITRLIMIILFYDWNFLRKKTKEGMPKEFFSIPVRKSAFKKWHIRLQSMFLWCTTPAEARKQAMETASELLAILSIDLDLVLSDVIAGVLLYRQKSVANYKLEKAARDDAPFIAAADGTPLERFPTDDVPSWMNLQSANKYMQIGLGIFGWQWYMITHLFCGIWVLLSHITCCLPCRKYSKTVLGDDCCGCSLAGLQAVSHRQYEDLVHVSFVDRIYEVPFYVTYDHQTSAVVVSIRGTMSMNDVLTDLTATFAVMDDPGCPQGAYCHGGMLNASREIKKKLEKNGVLENALRAHPGYQLIVTGHSLGAAVASILTMLLQNTYPAVRCYAFAPPPTVNEAVLPFTRNRIFTINYKNDVVGYMNYHNVNNMVIEIVRCLKECKVPKHRVFLNSSKALKACLEAKHDNYVTDPKINGTTNGSAYRENHFVNIDIEKSVEIRAASVRLYVAGTILHIWPHRDGYRLMKPNAHYYHPIYFRPNCIMDHFPQFLKNTIDDLGKEPVLEASTVGGSRTVRKKFLCLPMK